jgi:hypothetical protein
MAKEAFKHINFRGGTLALIDKCNEIIRGYQAQGYDLTLRQVYYQLVSRDLLANQQKEYDRLGSIINDARLTGLIDWSAIVDRTRNIRGVATYDNPEELIARNVWQYSIDKWENQKYRLEVWIEKDALAGVFSRVCNRNQVDFFSCRGYTSQSEMYVAAKRHQGYIEAGQTPIILHFGDHDPSGIDMSRDIRERLEMFNYGEAIKVDRLALNMNQVKQYNPPPNPNKETDSRSPGYTRIYGAYSWELDALNPETLSALVEEAVDEFRDAALWQDKVAQETEERNLLISIKDNLTDIRQFLRDKEEE